MLRNAWSRVFRKQLLVAYPLTLGLLSYLAFFALYSSLGGQLSWSEFARAAGNRYEFLRDNIDSLTTMGTALLVALVVGGLMVLLAGAIRAPYYRAIVGFGYPLAPRSALEVLRLSAYFLLLYVIFDVLPLLLPQPEENSLLAGLVYLTFLVIAALVMFADYVIVFEERGPVEAIARSAWLVRRGWVAAIGIFLLGNLLLSSVSLVYSDYYEGAEGIFLLFPFSQILIEAFLFVLFDVFLIYVYRYLAR